MATTKEEKDFILEQLGLEKIRARSMMGEYLLYYDDTLFGGIYDKKVLVKRNALNEKYQLEEVIPYDGAKPMYWMKDLDDKEKTKEIIIETCRGLKQSKK